MTSEMSLLPPNAIAYKKTPIFTQESIPKGLQKEHSTAKDVWGVINVLSGSLQYSITEPDQQVTFDLDSDTPGVIKEEQHHQVHAKGSVSFFIEFYRTKPRLP